jgi:DNA repair exonuclease SbcCD ATPase subunit
MSKKESKDIQPKEVEEKLENFQEELKKVQERLNALANEQNNLRLTEQRLIGAVVGMSNLLNKEESELATNGEVEGGQA